MLYEVVRNDITNMNVDAIVLPANSRLKEGSGASNAIFEKAGRKQLEKACRKYGNVNVGSAVPTLGYNLPSKYVIHAVVPKWKDGNHQEYELLSATYLSALRLADEIDCESIAFPLLASGNNGFDFELAYNIAVESIDSYKARNKLQKVYLVVYGMRVMSMLREARVSVKEVIDERYVLEKKAEYQLPIQRLMDEGQEIVQKFAEDGLKMVMEKLNNPEVRREILEKGVGITATIIKNHSKKLERRKNRNSFGSVIGEYN